MSPSIPKQGKAAQVCKYNDPAGPYIVQDVDVPEPTDDQLLIKMGAAGLCHTDFMVFEGQSPMPLGQDLPITGSHEPAGTVVKAGKNAAAAFKEGDRIGSVSFLGICGECDSCKNINPKYCTNLKGALGITHNGAFSEYAVVDYKSCAKLPESMSFEQAAPLCCAGTTIFVGIRKAARVANLKEGRAIGIIGLGALGLLGVQMAKAMGYKVIGVDARKEPIQLAKDLKKNGADLLINADTTSVEEALKQIKQLDSEGLSAVVVSTDAPPAFKYAIDILANHGTFLLLGQPEAGLTIPYNALIFRNLTIVGDLLGTAKDLKGCLELCAKEGIQSAVTTYSLQDINKAVEAAHKPDRKGKAVIVFK